MTLLLDTCAVIYFMEGTLGTDSLRAVVQAGTVGRLYVSAVSAWEIGLLERSGRMRFHPDPKTYFANVMMGFAIKPAACTPDIVIESSSLPGTLHGDPADRLLIATARHMDAALMTRDSKILAYGKSGHVQVLPC